jgi:uncharacterized Ntn-hydrolase superfamily protein
MGVRTVKRTLEAARSTLALAVLTAAPPATATYSIVAADRDSRQVGGAGTSCLEGEDVYVIYRAIAGVGVVHAQAALNFNGRDRAFELLGQGLAPQAILDEITSDAFDPTAQSRQYAIADVQGRLAAFTGATARDYAGDLQGAIGSLSYSVQGNILTGRAVLTQAASAFETEGCDLAERLMSALEAGADNAQGDSRCTDAGIPSDSAFIQVEAADRATGGFLSLRVPTSGSDNPLAALRADYDDWRSTHPCPAPAPDAGTGTGTGGSSAAGSGNASGQGGGATAGGASDGTPVGPAGCACRSPSSTRAPWPASAALPLLSAWFALLRRRARAR